MRSLIPLWPHELVKGNRGFISNAHKNSLPLPGHFQRREQTPATHQSLTRQDSCQPTTTLFDLLLIVTIYSPQSIPMHKDSMCTRAAIYSKKQFLKNSCLEDHILFY